MVAVRLISGTRHSSSPGTLRASRLVATIRGAGPARSSASTTRLHSSSRCSQLSRTISVLLDATCSHSVSRMPRPGCSRTFRLVAIAEARSLESASGARSTHHAPL